MSSTRYEHDAYAWALEQAALLRAGQLEQLDLEHLAEEIESMGKSEKRALTIQLTRLLMHVLKWELQPERRSRSWKASIEDAQAKVERLLDENPSLRTDLTHLMTTAYKDACRATVIEADVDSNLFPDQCPYTFDDAITFRAETQ